MSANTARFVIPYPVAGDAVQNEPATLQAQANRLDLLLGEGGSFTNSAAIVAATTYSQAVSFARSYTGSVGAGSMVMVEITSTHALPNVWNYWITALTGTGFTLNVQFTNAQPLGTRTFLWRFLPCLP